MFRANKGCEAHHLINQFYIISCCNIFRIRHNTYRSLNTTLIQIKPVCPSCEIVCGILKGDQPDGDMTIELKGVPLAGYEDCDTTMITYSFDNGKQQVLYC